MAEEELSLEERRKQYMYSGISFIIVFFGFLAYTAYVLRSGLLQAGWLEWDVLVKVVLPYSIIGSASFFATYEATFPKRVKRSFVFHMKRFVYRTISCSIIPISLFASASISQSFFYSALGNNALFPGMVMWVVVFAGLGILWLRRRKPSILKSA